MNLGIFFYKKINRNRICPCDFFFSCFLRAKNGLEIYIFVIIWFNFVVGWNTGGPKRIFLG